MSAMDNDLNRCNYMLSADRRCRSLIHTPSSPFCYFHRNGGSRKRKPASPDGAADRALFQWLASHPLDSFTNVNHAINLITLLLAGKRISVRRSDALLRLLRVALKSVPDVHEEFDGYQRRSHCVQGEQFLSEIQPLLAAPAPSDPPDSPVSPPPAPGPATPVPPAADDAATSTSIPAPLARAAAASLSSSPAGDHPQPVAVPNSAAASSPSSAAAASNAQPSAVAPLPSPPRPPQASPAPLAGSPAPVSLRPASPHPDPLLPLVEKHLPSILRALLFDPDFDLLDSPKRPASASAPAPKTRHSESDRARDAIRETG